MWLIGVAGCFHPPSSNKGKWECKMHFSVWNSHCKLHGAEEGCTRQDTPRLEPGALGRIHNKNKLAVWLQKKRLAISEPQNKKLLSAFRCRRYFSPDSSPNLSFGSLLLQSISVHMDTKVSAVVPFCWHLAVFDSETFRSTMTNDSHSCALHKGSV